MCTNELKLQNNVTVLILMKHIHQLLCYLEEVHDEIFHWLTHEMKVLKCKRCSQARLQRRIYENVFL